MLSCCFDQYDIEEDHERNEGHNDVSESGSNASTSESFILQMYLQSLKRQGQKPALLEAAKLYAFIHERGASREKGDMLLKLLSNVNLSLLPGSCKAIEQVMARHRDEIGRAHV